MVVQHHAAQLERLDVVLVQHEGFLEALHRRLKIAQLSGKRKNQESDSPHVVSETEGEGKYSQFVEQRSNIMCSLGKKKKKRCDVTSEYQQGCTCRPVQGSYRHL